jgi:hypothetical protein
MVYGMKLENWGLGFGGSGFKCFGFRMFRVSGFGFRVSVLGVAARHIFVGESGRVFGFGF